MISPKALIFSVVEHCNVENKGESFKSIPFLPLKKLSSPNWTYFFLLQGVSPIEKAWNHISSLKVKSKHILLRHFILTKVLEKPCYKMTNICNSRFWANNFCFFLPVNNVFKIIISRHFWIWLESLRYYTFTKRKWRTIRTCKIWQTFSLIFLF